MTNQEKNIEPSNLVQEPSPQYGFVSKSEDEKLREDVFRSDWKNFSFLRACLRRNALLNKAVYQTRRIINWLWMFLMKN
jgi:hypothetical protein